MTKRETMPDVFQAIADPTRRQILQLLATEEMSISAIVECFPISRTAVNKHLHVLLNANLVQNRKVGRETRYRLQLKPLSEVTDWLNLFDMYWDEKLAALKEFVENGEA